MFWVQDRGWRRSGPDRPAESRKRRSTSRRLGRQAGKHTESFTLDDAFFHGLGHEDQFAGSPPSDRYRCGETTFARTRSNGRDAPIPAVRVWTLGRESTQPWRLDT